MNNNAEQAREMFETLSNNSQQWSYNRVREPQKKAGVYEVQSGSNMEAQIANLTDMVKQLIIPVSQVCAICGAPGHAMGNCPQNEVAVMDAQINALTTYPNQTMNPAC